MKTIAVILPINNPDILKQADLVPYQSDDYCFQLHYVDTHLRELNTADEVAMVLQLTIEKGKQVVADGAVAVIVYAFGELGIKEIKEITGVPVMALGPVAVREASRLSQKKFTILPGMLIHNEFLTGLVAQENLSHNYVSAKYSPEVSPAQIRQDMGIVQKLADIGSREVRENGIDVFTLGCGSFIGVAKPLQEALQAEFGPSISVVDPVEITFNFAKQQVAAPQARI